jgi:hypothetical protein
MHSIASVSIVERLALTACIAPSLSMNAVADTVNEKLQRNEEARSTPTHAFAPYRHPRRSTLAERDALNAHTCICPIQAPPQEHAGSGAAAQQQSDTQLHPGKHSMGGVMVCVIFAVMVDVHC